MAVLSSSRAPRFPLLDSVRALAALSVVGFHASFLSNVTLDGGAPAAFLSRLDVGVAIFFVLSGFLLSRPFVRAALLGGLRPSAGAYGWRRALRIVPAYWLALTVVALVVPGHGAPDPVDYVFLQTYSDDVFGGLSQAWTLCVEVTFYAFLPLWALALRPRAALPALGALVLVATAWNVAALLGAADPQHANTARALLWLPGFLDQFALGMALATVSVAAERDGRLPVALRWLERRAWPAWLAAAAAFALVAVGIGLSPRNRLDAPMTAAQALARHWLFAAVAVGVLLPAVFGPPRHGTIRRLLGHPLLLRLGTISYGVYLWHVGVMEQVEHWLPGLADGSLAGFAALALAGAVGAIAVAAASWRLVEKPLLGLKRLVPDRALPLRDPETHAPEEPAVPATAPR